MGIQLLVKAALTWSNDLRSYHRIPTVCELKIDVNDCNYDTKLCGTDKSGENTLDYEIHLNVKGGEAEPNSALPFLTPNLNLQYTKHHPHCESKTRGQI